MSPDTNDSTMTRHQKLVLVVTASIAAIALLVAMNWPDADALTAALQPLIKQPNTEPAHVADAILRNYIQTRSIAARWSGVYWGFTFCAATFSALAGLILKFESIIKRPELKKDIAAVLSVGAALLITISTSGDFQRKWQANRIAAAELERIGYDLLEKPAAEPQKYFAVIGEILHRRNLTVVGSSERKAKEEKSPSE